MSKYGLMTYEKSREADRSDAKWGHPLVREGWPKDSDISLYTKIYKINMTQEEVGEARALREQILSVFEAIPVSDKITAECIEYSESFEYNIPGCVEEPDAPLLKVRCCVPKDSAGKRLPVILLIPGGGLITSSASAMESSFSPCGKELAYKNNAVVVIPEYRCLPDWRYPSPLNDCHAAYQWILDNPEKLPLDTDSITIGGVSTGAHLALCLGFRVKRYGWKPMGIVAYNPISDDRMCKPSSRIHTYIGDLNGMFIKEYGAAYLGAYDSGSPYMGPEAFANYADMDDCKGYAPTFIITNEYDQDRDYNREFCEKLLNEGVPVEYHMWSGGSHSVSAIQASGTAEYMEPINYIIENAYYKCTHYDMRRPWTAE